MIGQKKVEIFSRKLHKLLAKQFLEVALAIFSVAVILSYRLRCFGETTFPMWERADPIWEGADPKRCFSVNANLLQGISESGLAVVGKNKKATKYFVS